MSDDFDHAPTYAAAAPATEEGCPTPLAWQDVVEALRQEGTRHQVEHDGITTTAVSLGEGPPLYLLPGFLGDHNLLALTGWLLREQYCCVLVDPPRGPAGGRTNQVSPLERWAASILQLADTLRHNRLRVYGSSFGGLLALQMMSRHADRLRAVALHCAFVRMRLSLVERCLVAAGMRSHRTLGALPSAMRIQQQNHRHWFPPFDSSRWEFFADNIASTPVIEAAARARAAGHVDLRGGLRQSTTPTLLIQSEGDGRAALAAQSEVQACLPQARLETLDNCGRLPHITHPHRLVKLLRNFWDHSP